ncbi:SdpI family protein [Kocuria sp. SM24M-10]|uniref:SdpI family protein n=1 Tax=Kocuria sp. SM24M-10 TaxID=1660349 RepID=UPI00069B65A2|nr:SdpI family protein [Kocuria sp. SM24M-10]
MDSTNILEVFAMTEEIAGLVPLLFALVLLPAMSIPVVRWAAEDALGRNGSAGIRTRHTKASDEAWAAGHAAALPVVRRMWPVAAVGLSIALVVQVLGGGYTGTAVAAVALVCEVVVLLRSAGAANRAARAVTASS